MNTFGRLFRFTSYGESHGPAIGGVIDGCPSGLRMDYDYIDLQLSRRSSRGGVSTLRKEPDRVDFLSGLSSNHLTTGVPIAFVISNHDTRASDYAKLSDVYRPSHADYTYQEKYGIRTIEGGGRSSARETASRVVAGAVASLFLRELGVEVVSYTSLVGGEGSEMVPYDDGVELDRLLSSLTGCPDAALDEEFYKRLVEARKEGDSLGGVVSTIVRGVPTSWGEPLYDKLHARLSYAMLSINAARAFEVGDGILMSTMSGSDSNDPFVLSPEGTVSTSTNHSGGVQGGISNGMTVRMRTFFKPISSIRKPQKSLSTTLQPVDLLIEGRHDASVFPRVLPVCDAMASLTLADFALLARSNRVTF